MAGLQVHIEVEGLTQLEQAFQNWPEHVIGAVDAAGKQAAPIVLQAIQKVTPVHTGFLMHSEDVAVVDHFNLQAEATAPYASFVHARVPFLDEGTAAALQQVEQIYEQAIDEVAEKI